MAIFGIFKAFCLLLMVLLPFYAQNQRVDVSTFRGCGLHFFISRQLWAVDGFEDRAIFKAIYSPKLTRYEKMKATSSKGRYINSLVLGIKW